VGNKCVTPNKKKISATVRYFGVAVRGCARRPRLWGSVVVFVDGNCLLPTGRQHARVCYYVSYDSGGRQEI
jgi:hypothetical protein